MTVTMLLYIVMGIGAGFCVAAALGAKFLLPSPKEASANKTQGTKKPEQRVEELRAKSMETAIDFDAFLSDRRLASPVSENVRNQLIFLDQVWPRTMAWVPSKEWQAVTEADRLFGRARMIQEKLDLMMPHVNYMELVNKMPPEGIEDLFHDTGRLSRSA